MTTPPESLRAFPPKGGRHQWPGQARSTVSAGMVCSATAWLERHDAPLLLVATLEVVR